MPSEQTMVNERFLHQGECCGSPGRLKALDLETSHLYKKDNVGLIDTGPASLPNATGFRLYCASIKRDAWPARSSAMLFATRGR